MQALTQVQNMVWSKNYFQLFSSKQVSSWSVGLVCRQSTMRESRDLNNEGNPPGWPWQIPRYENSWVKKEKSFCGFPGGISIYYLASGWPWSNLPDYVIHINISQTLGICFIFHAGNGNTRVQIFPNSKQGWQGQMTAGWFGEIQADFWMLLGRCVKGGLVDYLLSRASTDNTCAVINGVAPMFTQTLALFTKMAIGESISGREHHHRAIKKPYNYHNQAFCTINNMLYSWKKWGKGEISAKRKQ